MRRHQELGCACEPYGTGAGQQWPPRRSARDHRNRGVAIVWVAFLLLAVILVIGIGLDAARMYIDAHQLQNAADASALAAAQYVKSGYLDMVAPNPGNLFSYPEIVFRAAQGFANEHQAMRATVELFVADFSAYDPAVDVVIGHYRMQSREFTPYDPTDPNSKTPNAAKVIARQVTNWDGAGTDRSMPLIFGPIAGVHGANVSRYAIAMSIGATGAGLIALDEFPAPKDTGLQIGGNSTIDVNNGDVQVNSFSQNAPWQAFRADGTFDLNCDALNVCGDVYPPLGDPFWDGVDFNVHPNTEDPLADPLAHLPELWDPILGTSAPPSPPGYTSLPAPAWDDTDPSTLWKKDVINSAAVQTHGIWSDAEQMYVLTLTSGYYPGGFNLTATNCKVVLQPGTYALGGGFGPGDKSGLCITGGAFEAVGVMLYITTSTNGFYGRVDIRGGIQTNVKIHEAFTYPGDAAFLDPYPLTDYEYIAIFQDRANTNEAYINGSSEIDLKGSLYFRNANFRVGGDGIQAGTQAVAGTVEIDGGAVVHIDYDGRFFTAGYRSLLVE